MVRHSWAGSPPTLPHPRLTQPPYGPDQALPALEALLAMTHNTACAAGEEHEAGRLAVGHRAMPAGQRRARPYADPAGAFHYDLYRKRMRPRVRS